MTVAETSPQPEHASPVRPAAPRTVAAPHAPARHAATVLVVHGADELAAFRASWEALARAAHEPNVYHEPWMLLPALERFAPAEPLEIALVARRDGTLIGLFPFVRRARYRGLPLETLALWRHEHSFLATPLVHRGYARACLDTLFDWLDQRRGTALVEFGGVGGDGAFAHLLTDVLAARGAASWSAERYTRGLYRARADADGYFAEIMDGEARRRLRTKEKRLGEHGRVEHVALGPDGDAHEWIAEFLALEASGWKGREGTAMAAEPGRRQYFEAVVAEAHRRGQLEMRALRVDGRPVALKCNFRAGDGAFVWKIAYDEAYGRYSPGMLLEAANIRAMHAAGSPVRWMDSCANPASRLFGEACNERRAIETTLVATRSEAGRLALALAPLAQWASRAARVLRGAMGGRADERHDEPSGGGEGEPAERIANAPAGARPPRVRTVRDVDLARFDRARPPAVVLGDLSLVRPVAMAKIPVLLATPEPRDIAIRSRDVTDHCVLPGFDEASMDASVADLVALGERLERALGRRVPLFYNSDKNLEMIYRHRAALEAHYLLVLNEPAVALALHDKSAFYPFAERAGVCVPRTLQSAAAIERELGALREPLLVKPRRKDAWQAIHRELFDDQGKARVFATRAELLAHPGFARHRDAVIVQEYLEGEVTDLVSFHGFADAHGTLLASYCGRKVRTQPRFAGESACIELCDDPALAAVGRDVAARLGLRGVFKIDLLHHRARGLYYTLEVNARFNLWNHLGAACGSNLAAVAYEYLVHARAPAAGEHAARPTHRWVHFYRDVHAFRELHARGELAAGAWLAQLAAPRVVHETFAWHDPAPFAQWAAEYVGARLGR